ncbi:hypothetical protein DL93DRAFT_2173140 [Clavulina sp. PMI_390]|nr:hypothetical protein DL93DRAFT_2173140 [Clavulina sp. PMI_390]
MAPAAITHLWRRRSPIVRTIFVICLGIVSFILVVGSMGARRDFRSISRLYTNWFNRLPPLYPQYAAEEVLLAQHNVSLSFPEGQDGRFIRFEDQMWGLGLNNQLFEILLNSEIALRSNRAYAFTPFIWDAIAEGNFVPLKSDTHLPAALPTKFRATRIPLRAIIQSPTSGEPWPIDHTPPPRAVSHKWYDQVCPWERRVVINTIETNERIGVNFDRDNVVVIIERWSAYLRNLNQSCVHINWDAPRINDFRTMGDPALEQLWPSFSTSPVMTAFRWSNIVYRAVEKNIRLLGLSSSPMRIEGRPNIGLINPDVLTGLVTLHVRRQDFTARSSQLSFLPDRLFIPHSASGSEEERAKLVFPRCWLEIDAIVQRLHSLRTEYSNASKRNDGKEGKREILLRKVHIATNGEPEWVDELKRALWRDGWGRMTSTYDMDLDWEESGTPMDGAIDLEMATRGEVFVGNGFSTFTSTTVSLRLVRGIPPNQTRFW